MEGQVCYNQDGCGARVAQLRRLVWVLLAWASLLTAALVVSISLQFFYPRAFSLTEPASGPVLSPAPLKRTSLHLFDYSSWDNNSGMLVWQKFPEGNITQHIEVEHDGNYFLYLQLTLQSTNTGVNYLIEVKRVLEGDQHDVILKRHINKSENSTGLMGKGLLLSAGTNVHVTCKPATQFSKQDTYLGMIKL
ncbi:tumor necrosis factor ligand superfamily member 18 isoform X1 [Electrophorus electricus]|uniref:tumor necrosis factor ligand superfamily member 18 isoform X1 n=1 Tax=Electrophorus electricus TaxID=8005 RepID=UPI0015D079D7|nr:tumor necrosis factor ligand superfamily member 18 isoform X1 [Electrophorus electricus]